MRGRDRYNFPTFDEVRDRALAVGHDVLSPADMDRATGFHGNKKHDYDFDLKRAILRDIEALSTCEAIILLPDWHLSSGARVELAAAQFLGVKGTDATKFQPIPAKVIGVGY